VSSEDHLTLLLSEMIRAETEVRSAFSPRVALEMALIRASFLNVLKPIQEAIENIESFVADRKVQTHKEQGLQEDHAVELREEENPLPEEGTAQKPASAESTHEKSEAVPLSETPSLAVFESAPSQSQGDTLRKVFLQRLESLNHLLAIKLSEAEVRVEDDSLVITFNGGAAIHADSVKKNIELVRQAAEEVLRKKVSVKIEIAKKKIPRKKDMKEKVLSDPLVKEAIELFEGRIVNIRPMDNSKNGGSDV